MSSKKTSKKPTVLRSPASSPPTIAGIIAMMPNAVSAPDYERAGGSFDKAQMHITSTLDNRDRKGLKATLVTFAKYGHLAHAYHLGPCFGAYSLEVLFDASVGDDAVHLWNKTV
ncbi:hypothetical protein AFCDBAGC_5033 [Methylobacterium cerastii]|uniref:Uncharacterized protein n=1 Tax=Methylobacterium cerastii TaxID=932741 RepID=A0ABQ4QPL9_9HYPH|nr:hypothetical protein [Methylobacterium cerastii]GJD47147.1 hypothetical protein AFCDBAGC_5033 [Methylobacterium cerastii]